MKNFSAKITLAAFVGIIILPSLVHAEPKQKQDRGPAPQRESHVVVMLRANPYAKPYVPQNFAVKNEAGEMCGAEGYLTPGKRGGRCWDISSIENNSFWRIRGAACCLVGAERVFKIDGDKVVIWAIFDQKNKGNAELFSSPEARKYAGLAESGSAPPVAQDKDRKRDAKDRVLDALPRDIFKR